MTTQMVDVFLLSFYLLAIYQPFVLPLYILSTFNSLNQSASLLKLKTFSVILRNLKLWQSR